MSDGSKHLRRSPTDSVMRMTACTVRPYISSPLTCSVNSFSMDDSFRRLATFSTTWSQIPAQSHSEAVNSQTPPLHGLGGKPERVKQGCCHLVPGGDSYFVVLRHVNKIDNSTLALTIPVNIVSENVTLFTHHLKGPASKSWPDL